MCRKWLWIMTFLANFVNTNESECLGVNWRWMARRQDRMNGKPPLAVFSCWFWGRLPWKKRMTCHAKGRGNCPTAIWGNRWKSASCNLEFVALHNYTSSRWWFPILYFFKCSPLLLILLLFKIPSLTNTFSNGLKPPTGHQTWSNWSFSS